MGGKRYTYMCDDGLKLSKLDRFSVFPNFIARQPLATIQPYLGSSPITHMLYSTPMWLTLALLPYASFSCGC